MAKESTHPVRSGWLKYFLNRDGLMLGSGMFLELLLSISALLIRSAMYSSGEAFRAFFSFISPSQLFLINSCIGFFAATLIAAGLIKLAYRLRITVNARYWVYVASGLFIVYRSFDILQSYRWQAIGTFLGTSQPVDLYISNVLLVSSCLSLLIGLVRALLDSDLANKTLESQNTVLIYQIHQLQRLEENARKNETQLTVLLNSISSPIFFTTVDGIILACNDTFVRLFGKGETDLKSRHLRDVLPFHLFLQGKNCAEEVAASGEMQFFKGKHRDRVYECTMYPVVVYSGEISHICTLALDITEKLRAEEELRLLEAAVSNTAESIMITDTEGEIKYVNPAFEIMTGYTAQETKNRPSSFLGDQSQTKVSFREMWRTLQQGQVWRGIFLNKRKDGSSYEEKATISPITDEQGCITHYVAVKRDVSQEQQMEQHLIQIQKMKNLGLLAGGIAHNLNNALTIILGRSELALELMAADEPARESIGVVIRTAQTSSKLIKQILTFAKQNSKEAEVVKVGPLLQESIKVMRSCFPTNITIHENINALNALALVDPNELQQIVVNLLENSQHALQPDGGSIDISLDLIDLEEVTPTLTGNLPSGRYLRFTVSDTGHGMDPQVAEHAFDPFYSTKDVGEGMGLGLSTVHGSVKRVGGGIRLYSSPGAGTTIEIFWPEEKMRPLKPAFAVESKPDGKGISVLVVDDLQDIVEMMVVGLKSYGFQVKIFSDSASALEFMEQDPAAIDIAVLDYMMPKMNGIELAKRLRAFKPDLPSVLLSGYRMDVSDGEAKEVGFVAILSKPILIEELARTLVRYAKTSDQEPPVV